MFAYQERDKRTKGKSRQTNANETRTQTGGDGSSHTYTRGLTAVVLHFRHETLRRRNCAVLCVRDRSALLSVQLGFKNLKNGRETLLSDIEIYVCDSRSNQ
jgi:hypothetical protein